MSIDVQIVALAEDIASAPALEMYDWLDTRFQDYDHRYGFVALRDRDVADLEQRFGDDPVAKMLLKKVASMKAGGERARYVIELMIG